MPLNRLKPRNHQIPNTHDAEPLVEKDQVFGKTCACRELTMAAVYVKSHGIDTVTMDGNKVNRKGTLTGGYHDVRRSKLSRVSLHVE